MTTILDAINEANGCAGIQTWRFANIKEFASFMESFTFDDYPINVVVPFTSNGTHIGGRRTSVIPLQGWILTRVMEEPLDLRSQEAESKYIQPMRNLAVKFINRLLQSDIVDPEVESVTDTIRPEYMFLSGRVFGVSYSCNIPVTQYVC